MSRLGLAAAAIVLGGCVGDGRVARELAAASTPPRMLEVEACWEKQFEHSVPGEYRARADLTVVVEAGVAHFRSARVTELAHVNGAEAADERALRTCVERALDLVVLPREADADGPGFITSVDLHIENFEVRFVDASSDSRKKATQRSKNVLLGPRADRCQGLFTHDPPRDGSVLYAEIARAQDRAQRLVSGDRDEYARELQRTYDLAIELRERLTADLASPGLPDANRRRTRKALDEADALARKIGAQIGCTPPR